MAEFLNIKLSGDGLFPVGDSNAVEWGMSDAEWGRMPRSTSSCSTPLKGFDSSDGINN